MFSACLSTFSAQLLAIGCRSCLLLEPKKRSGICLNQAPISAPFFFHFDFRFRLCFRHALMASGAEILRRVSSKFRLVWQHRVSIIIGLRPMTMETRCCKVCFPKIYILKNGLKIRSYRRCGKNGGENVFHAGARGGTCAFTLKIVNTLIKNSSRDDRPSISTYN